MTAPGGKEEEGTLHFGDVDGLIAITFRDRGPTVEVRFRSFTSADLDEETKALIAEVEVALGIALDHVMDREDPGEGVVFH